MRLRRDVVDYNHGFIIVNGTPKMPLQASCIAATVHGRVEGDIFLVPQARPVKVVWRLRDGKD